MSARMQKMRNTLYAKLKDKGTPGNWEHLIQQIGMFNYTGINRKFTLNLWGSGCAVPSLIFGLLFRL